MAALEELGEPTWFRLGDRDLALHVYRRERLAAGLTLTEICLLYTSPSPRDYAASRMPSSA